MDDNKLKEGVSVKELETFAKKHRFEVFFCLAFILACCFTFVMWGPGWSIIATTIGAIVGALFSGKVTQLCKTAMGFVFKHEQTTQIVLGVIVLILAVFIPPLIFLIVGLNGGKDLHHWAVDASQKNH